MAKYIIEGGNKLEGEVKIESAKNAVLPIIAASLLTSDDVLIKNCPKIEDVFNMINVLRNLGAKCEFVEDNLFINSKNVFKYSASKKLTEKLRSSVLAIGALLSRKKKAKFSFPGGCKIGKRPIDIHISVFRSLGVTVNEKESGIDCFCKEIVGADIQLPFPSVGATENAILCASLGKGKTTILNCAREPEIVDLANFINKMGGKISGAGSGKITIEGVSVLHGVEYKPIPDRIECGTFLIATAICGGEIEIRGFNAKNISSLVSKFSNNACKVYSSNGIIILNSRGYSDNFLVETGPYPLFPTDLQPQMAVLGLKGRGCSVIKENIFDNRFLYLSELKKMGAKYRLDKNIAYLYPSNLKGAKVRALDLRGGASLVLAGLLAEGITEIDDIYHIKRGYLDLDKKLTLLGAKIREEK
ncbi:MAG: UDP-N-acetylglucosamine 1-carboxyvinyltransferase [Clostridia bacterium]|nr:UDP-N-acetylglucosamine 1-carboxyvinyltransferase [Clostridia bacterium]